MPSIGDQNLAVGCAVNVEAVHGETIRVLSGLDQGISFTAVKEIEADIEFETAVSLDVRGKRVVRFRDGAVPRLNSQDTVQTDDGKKWTAVRMPQNSFLTVDFELKEIAAGKDT